MTTLALNTLIRSTPAFLQRIGHSFAAFLDGCRAKNVFIKWFGAKEPAGFTSQSHSWAYIADPHTPANTARILDRLCDLRIPLTLEADQCDRLVAIIGSELARCGALREG